MGIAPSKCRSQEIEEATGRLFPNLVLRLRSGTLAEGVPDTRERGLSVCSCERIDLGREPEPDPPPEHQMGHRIGCASMRGMVLGALPIVAQEGWELGPQ